MKMSWVIPTRKRDDESYSPPQEFKKTVFSELHGRHNQGTEPYDYKNVTHISHIHGPFKLEWSKMTTFCLNFVKCYMRQKGKEKEGKGSISTC